MFSIVLVVLCCAPCFNTIVSVCLAASCFCVCLYCVLFFLFFLPQKCALSACDCSEMGGAITI